jgi:hypothetical protein
MCTVTIVPHERGVRLVCNRDERRSRPAALPPRIHHLGGRRSLFPVDPQGGGTWIGVNDAGVIVALLNLRGAFPPAPVLHPRWRSFATHVINSQSKRSRGLIVRELMRCPSLRRATEAVQHLDPRGFEPFRVVILHGDRVAVAASDGVMRIQCTQWRLEAPLLFTSSSLGDALVGPPRQRLFERVVIRNRTGWLDGQARFHNHQWSRRPEISIRMERADALTVSRASVDVTNDTRQLLYEAPLGAANPDRVREWCSLR